MKYITNISKLINLEKILSLGDQAIMSGGNFLLAVLVTRFLGLAVLGEFTLYMMALLVGLSLNQAFITKPLLSLFPQKPEKIQHNYFGALLGVQLLMGLVIGLASVLGLLYFGMLDFAYILGGIVFFGMLHDGLRKFFFVSNKIKAALVIDVALQGVTLLGIMLLSVLGELYVKTLFLTLLWSYGIAVLLALFFIEKIIIKPRNIKQCLKEHLQYGKWLIGTAFLQWFSSNFFVVATNDILGVVAVGAIRMVQNLMGLCHVFFLTLENIIPQRAALHYKEGGQTQLKKYLRKVNLEAGIVVGLIFLVIGVFSSELIYLIYKKSAADYDLLLYGYIATYILVFLGHSSRFALRTYAKTSPIFIAYVITSVISLLCAYPLIIEWGLVGYLLGIFFAQFVTQSVYWIALFMIENKKSFLKQILPKTLEYEK